MRRRPKNYPVKVTHEDVEAVRRAGPQLTPGEVEAIAACRASARNAQGAMGPDKGWLLTLAATLPREWVKNAAKNVLAAA